MQVRTLVGSLFSGLAFEGVRKGQYSPAFRFGLLALTDDLVHFGKSRGLHSLLMVSWAVRDVKIP